MSLSIIWCDGITMAWWQPALVSSSGKVSQLKTGMTCRPKQLRWCVITPGPYVKQRRCVLLTVTHRVQRPSAASLQVLRKVVPKMRSEHAERFEDTRNFFAFVRFDIMLDENQDVYVTEVRSRLSWLLSIHKYPTYVANTQGMHSLHSTSAVVSL